MSKRDDETVYRGVVVFVWTTTHSKDVRAASSRRHSFSYNWLGNHSRRRIKKVPSRWRYKKKTQRKRREKAREKRRRGDAPSSRRIERYILNWVLFSSEVWLSRFLGSNELVSVWNNAFFYSFSCFSQKESKTKKKQKRESFFTRYFTCEEAPQPREDHPLLHSTDLTRFFLHYYSDQFCCYSRSKNMNSLH
jgi:hypothetical protein